MGSSPAVTWANVWMKLPPPTSSIVWRVRDASTAIVTSAAGGVVGVVGPAGLEPPPPQPASSSRQQEHIGLISSPPATAPLPILDAPPARLFIRA